MNGSEHRPDHSGEAITGFIPAIVRRFLSGHLSVLLIILAVLLPLIELQNI